MTPEILFEDDSIVAVNKPSGVFVHAAPGHEKGSLADFLAATRPVMQTVGSASRPGVVHRLDAETSGVLIFAKTQAAYLDLRRQFESHKGLIKKYLAVVHGRPHEMKGTIETTIGKKPWDAHRMACNVPDGVRALTHWEVVQRRGHLALVEFTIETGRMHQIRLHAVELGCPIVGDKLYGDRNRDLTVRPQPKRLMLHAVELIFRHPLTHRPMTLAAMPPAELLNLQSR